MPVADELSFASQVLAQLATRPVRFGKDYCPHYHKPAGTTALPQQGGTTHHVFRPAASSSTTSTPCKASSNAVASASDLVTLVAKPLKGAGPSHEVIIARGSSVAALKEALEPLTGLASKDQRLVIKGKALQDGHTLSDYGIADGSVVHILARPGSVPSVPIVAEMPNPQERQQQQQQQQPAAPELSSKVSATLQQPSRDPLESRAFWSDLRRFLRQRNFPGGDEQADAVLKEFMGPFRSRLQGDMLDMEVEL